MSEPAQSNGSRRPSFYKKRHLDKSGSQEGKDRRSLRLTAVKGMPEGFKFFVVYVRMNIYSGQASEIDGPGQTSAFARCLAAYTPLGRWPLTS